MVLIRLGMENIAPLFTGTSLLTQICNEADVKFTQLAFSVYVRNPSHRFVAIMVMPYNLFPYYAVLENQLSRISLQGLHSALLEGQDFPSMTIHLLGSDVNRLILRFENASFTPQLRHELALSPPEGFALGYLCKRKSFSIVKQVFRRIIRALSGYHDHTIVVTVTNFEVKFSVASEEIVLRSQRRECLIVDEGGEPVIELRITLHPTSFFLNLANQASRVWFFKTEDSRSVINVPYHANARYMIYFPRM